MARPAIKKGYAYPNVNGDQRRARAEIRAVDNCQKAGEERRVSECSATNCSCKSLCAQFAAKSLTAGRNARKRQFESCCKRGSERVAHRAWCRRRSGTRSWPLLGSGNLCTCVSAHDRKTCRTTCSRAREGEQMSRSQASPAKWAVAEKNELEKDTHLRGGQWSA